jgi:hypothetical protein
MKTDDDVREGLRRASRLIRPLEEPLERFDGRRAARRHRDRVVSAAVALVVTTAVLGGAVAVLVGRHGDDGRPGASAENARLEVQPGQFSYLKQTTASAGDGSVIQQETWWAPDGSGELRFDTNRPDKYVPYPPEGVYAKGEFPLPWQDDLSSLSTDPRVLEEQLRERSGAEGGSPAPEFAPDGGGPSTTGRMWRAIRRLLELPQALPDLREALFEVASGLPGVSRESGVVDPAGREAVRLDLSDDGEGHHWVFFFDPETHQLMAESLGWAGRGDVHLLTLLDAGIVESVGVRPAVEQLLFPPPTGTSKAPFPDLRRRSRNTPTP